jgi:hypothetical protein
VYGAAPGSSSGRLDHHQQQQQSRKRAREEGFSSAGLLGVSEPPASRNTAGGMVAV